MEELGSWLQTDRTKTGDGCWQGVGHIGYLTAPPYSRIDRRLAWRSDTASLSTGTYLTHLGRGIAHGLGMSHTQDGDVDDEGPRSMTS